MGGGPGSTAAAVRFDFLLLPFGPSRRVARSKERKSSLTPCRVWPVSSTSKDRAHRLGRPGSGCRWGASREIFPFRRLAYDRYCTPVTIRVNKQRRTASPLPSGSRN